MYKHLRVTCDRETGIKVSNDFIDKFKPLEYAVSYEDKDGNQHIHAHLYYDNVPKKQTISDFFKRYENVKGYYHKELKKEPIDNLLYVLKDLDIIRHNIDQERYQQLISTTKRINADKKKHARHKLLEIIEEEYRQFNEKAPSSDNLEQYLQYYEKAPYVHLSDISRKIIKIYVEDYDKEPPLAHLRGYVLYIAQKMIKQWERPNCHIKMELDIYYDKLF